MVLSKMIFRNIHIEPTFKLFLSCREPKIELGNEPIMVAYPWENGGGVKLSGKLVYSMYSMGKRWGCQVIWEASVLHPILGN